MKKNNIKKRLCGWIPDDVDDFEVDCIGTKIDKNSQSWCIHKIITVGQKGLCTSEDLSFFLPNFPKIHGSELFFLVEKRDVDNKLLPDLIRGFHLIEMKYQEDTGYENGFGSPSPTYNFINLLMKINKDKGIGLYNWVAANGGNYYIKPNVTYKEKKKDRAL